MWDKDEPDSGDDGLFHQWFGSLRESMPQVSRDLSQKVIQRINEFESQDRLKAPSVDQMAGGVFKDMVNVISRWFKDDDDGEQ